MCKKRRRRNHYIDFIERTAQQPVGYCWNPIHRGMLSKTLIKSHRCEKKSCPYFEKYMDTHAKSGKGRCTISKEDKKEYQQLRKDYYAGRISAKQYLKLKSIKTNKTNMVYQYYKDREYEKTLRKKTMRKS